MSYALDANILIELRKGSGAVADEIRKRISIEVSDAYITLMTFAEYFFGCLDASREGQEDCLKFLNAFEHLPLTKISAMLYAKLTHHYKKGGINFSPMDMLTASIAIENNMTLITSDKAFERIKELKKIIISK